MKNAFIFALSLMLSAAPAGAQTLKGPAVAIDGRTLEMTGTAIRLAYIDAPEAQQACTKDELPWPCGLEAKASLAEIVATETISCAIIGTDDDAVPLVQCETKVFDIGREMVRRGMAIPLDTGPSDYGEANRIAQRLRFGLWSGEFDQPAQWRLANPQSVFTIARAAPAEEVQALRSTPVRERRYVDSWGCSIKGNRSRRGEWIYHLPGQNYYEVTRPEELFCTEREAQAAGYRRSKE